MAQIKDGWHKVHEKDVYVENGKVVRGVTKEYSEDHGCWINISGEVTLPAYRAGYKKGTMCMK